jgi:hypothetical protein
MTQLKSLPRHLPGGTGKDYETPQVRAAGLRAEI